ncbi:glycosyltransferase family 2 protein [Salana multivorans]
MPEPIRDAVVVVPLYNEEQVIGDVVTDLHRRFPTVVCIDDGSTDGSIEVARRAGALVLEHAVNLGQGAALQTGMSYAWRHTDARYVVTFDADGQHQVDDAADMIDRAREKNLAIVFGSRFLDDRTDPGFMKKLVLAAAVRVTNATTGLRLTDAHNGLRVIRRDAGEQIELTQDRMAHASEIVADLGKTGLPWAEHPVHVLYTDYSRAKGQSVLNGVNILVDLLFH